MKVSRYKIMDFYLKMHEMIDIIIFFLYNSINLIWRENNYMKNKNSKRNSSKDNEFQDFIILFSDFVECIDNFESEDEYGFEYEFDDEEDLPF